MIAAVGLFFCLFLAGCGGGGGSDSETSTSASPSESIVVSGGAIKGVIGHGIVNAWNITRDGRSGRYELAGKLGRAVTTDSQGRFQLPISGKKDGWVLVELTADNETRMTCDVVPACFSGTPNAVAFGETFPLSAGFRLRAVVNLTDSREVYLTPLSSLAVALAGGSDEGLSPDALLAAYGELEAHFGLSAGTLQLSPPDLVRLDGFSGSTDAIQLAVINAAFLAMVDGTTWSSIDEVLADSEAWVQSEGMLPDSGQAMAPTIEQLTLEAAVISQGLRSEVADGEVLAALDEVSDRTEAFYALVAGAGQGDGAGSGEESGEESVDGSTTIIDRSATLSWDAPLTRQSGVSIAMGELQGYEIVYGQSASALTHSVVIEDASRTQFTIENLADGDWYFAVRAIDTEGLASPMSDVVSKSIQG